MFVVGVAAYGRGAGRESHAVARKAELLYYQRFAQLAGQCLVLCYVVVGKPYGLGQLGLHAFGRYPAPVVGPYMAVDVCDFGKLVYSAAQLHILLAAVPALRAGRYHVVGVEAAYQTRRAFDPPGESLFVGVGECAGLVADLPREYGRIVRVCRSGIAVGAREDEADVVVE